MPLFNFGCKECNHSEEHFIYANSEKELTCPKCHSARYSRQVSRFRMNVEYADNQEWLDNKVQPHVDEAYEKIGREAVNEDASTLENLFGQEKVDNTFSKYNE